MSASIKRMIFLSRQDFAVFALQTDSPRFSVIWSQPSFSDDATRAAFGLQRQEALFSDDKSALWREAIQWEKNGLRVYLDKAGEHPGWEVEAKPSFPDSLLENVFLFAAHCPAIDAPVEAAEGMALEQICDQDEHPLIFLDRLEPIDADFLKEVAADHEEGTGWYC